MQMGRGKGNARLIRQDRQHFESGTSEDRRAQSKEDVARRWMGGGRPRRLERKR